MKEIEEQINIMQLSIDNLIKLSYESNEIYNSPFGKILDTVLFQMTKNIEKLRFTAVYLEGVV